MLYIELHRKLKKLNPRLFVQGSEAMPNAPWGIYLRDQDGMNRPKHMCGINGNRVSVPELTMRRWDGYILMQGWRRILKILIDRKVVDLKKAEQIFGTNLREKKSPLVIEQDPLTRATNEAKARGMQKTGLEDYVEVDDLVDIHRWREKLRQDKSNYWA